ncbi:hypothetical protein [Faecalibacillus intestinalis]|uniref:hypothetical protein n=1 Tax=Faecalibacillus intestinalis TaxID=1982626 RepID=UPI0039931BAD
MKNIQEKRKILNDLLNLYNQYEFIKNDTAGKESITAIIKGKEDKFMTLVKGERNGQL